MPRSRRARSAHRAGRGQDAHPGRRGSAAAGVRERRRRPAAASRSSAANRQDVARAQRPPVQASHTAAEVGGAAPEHGRHARTPPATARYARAPCRRGPNVKPAVRPRPPPARPAGTGAPSSCSGNDAPADREARRLGGTRSPVRRASPRATATTTGCPTAALATRWETASIGPATGTPRCWQTVAPAVLHRGQQSGGPNGKSPHRPTGPRPTASLGTQLRPPGSPRLPRGGGAGSTPQPPRLARPARGSRPRRSARTARRRRRATGTAPRDPGRRPGGACVR